MCVYNLVVTCSYLQKVGIHTDPTCCLCKGSEESLYHLFFECPFVGRVWKAVADWCGVSRIAEKWELEKNFIISQSTNNNAKQRLYRCMVSVVSYHVWKERNTRRLQGKEAVEEIIIRQCQLMLAVCRQRDRKLCLVGR